MSEDYERLIKLAREGDASVGVELLEAARRRNDAATTTEALRLVVDNLRSEATDLVLLGVLLEPIASFLPHDEDALRALDLPNFNRHDGKPCVPPAVWLETHRLLAWDLENILLLVAREDGTRELQHHSDHDWLFAFLHRASSLIDLDERLDEVLGYIDTRPTRDHRYRLEDVCFGLPTFGRPPSESERPDDAGYWEILSYDGDEVMVTRDDPRNRYTYGYEDYETGYE